MSTAPSLRTMLHGGLAVSLALLAVIGSATMLVAVSRNFSGHITALNTASELAAEYSLRLHEQREAVREQLSAIGANPENLATLAGPEDAKALVETACSTLAAEFSGSCALEETPVTKTLSLHQARLTATSPLTLLAARLGDTVKDPVRIASLSIAPGPLPDGVTIAALLEVAGARTVSEDQ